MTKLQDGFYLTRTMWNNTPIIRYDLTEEGFEQAYKSLMSPIIVVQDNKVVTYRRPDMINWERENDEYSDIFPFTLGGTMLEASYANSDEHEYKNRHIEMCEFYTEFLTSRIRK
jgi:hypothetical protein